MQKNGTSFRTAFPFAALSDSANRCSASHFLLMVRKDVKLSQTQAGSGSSHVESNILSPSTIGPLQTQALIVAR